MIYGYARVSTAKQDLDRQVREILAYEPKAKLYVEKYTGKVIARPEWQKLVKRVKSGDTIIFEKVDRMSRDAADGVQAYIELMDKGVNLVFLKQHNVDTAVYKQALERNIPMTGESVDLILEGVNNFLKDLAMQQVRLAFDNAEEYAKTLSDRTKGGIETARRNGKQIGQKAGAKLTIKKEAPAKEIIKKHSKAFGGNLNDAECIELAKVSRNTYYKYKKELANEE